MARFSINSIASSDYVTTMLVFNRLVKYACNDSE